MSVSFDAYKKAFEGAFRDGVSVIRIDRGRKSGDETSDETTVPKGFTFDGPPFKMGPEHLARLTWGKKDGYDSLRAVLAQAVEQASGGKGAERHSNRQPFDQQPICQGGRRFGIAGLVYQCWKKSHEVPVLLAMDDGKARAVRELLGVINYAAAAILVLQEGMDDE